MSEFPAELKYASSHEWTRLESDGSVVVGITDHAQDALGDVVYIELPEVGAHVDAGAEVAVIESVKAASDIYSPVTGDVTEINPALEDEPIIFVQAALTKGLGKSIQELMKPSSNDKKKYDTATFYSISNCQEGLSRVTLGNFLIKVKNIIAIKHNNKSPISAFGSNKFIPRNSHSILSKSLPILIYNSLKLNQAMYSSFSIDAFCCWCLNSLKVN